MGKVYGLFKERVETTETTERDATESVLLTSIQSAAMHDHITEQEAACQLYQRMRSHPQLGDLNAYPAQYQAALRELDQQQPVTEISDQ